MILHFLSDFVRDKKVQAAFAKNPRAVAKKYKLSPEECALLSARGHKALPDYVKKEVSKIISAQKSSTVPLAWGVEGLSVSSVKATPKQPSDGVEFDIVVRGSNFDSDMVISFGQDGDGSTRVDADETTFVSSTELHGTATLDAGKWDVGVADDTTDPVTYGVKYDALTVK
jgi:hypothetical protein